MSLVRDASYYKEASIILWLRITLSSSHVLHYPTMGARICRSASIA